MLQIIFFNVYNRILRGDIIKMKKRILVTGGLGLVGAGIQTVINAECPADEEWFFCGSKDANLRWKIKNNIFFLDSFYNFWFKFLFSATWRRLAFSSRNTSQLMSCISQPWSEVCSTTWTTTWTSSGTIWRSMTMFFCSAMNIMSRKSFLACRPASSQIRPLIPSMRLWFTTVLHTALISGIAMPKGWLILWIGKYLTL